MGVARTERARHVVEAPPTLPPEIGRGLWSLSDARRRTESVLLGVRPPEVTWRERGASGISDILYHVAAIEADWLYTEILERPFPDEISALFPLDVRDSSGAIARVDESLEELQRRLAVVRRALHDSLAAMSSDEFRRPRALPQYDVSPEWVVHHLLQHEAEHRAEMQAARIAAERALTATSEPGAAGSMASSSSPGS